MTRVKVLGLAVMAFVLAPSASGAALLDTVTVKGSTPSFFNINVNASSGTSGENPGGSVSFGTFAVIHGQSVPIGVGGPVTCLNVTNNTATIKFDASEIINGSLFHLGPAVATAVDNGGTGMDGFGASPSFNPTDCSASFALSGEPLNGRAIVFDAPPVPTTKDQCKNGGWRNYPQFKNQGQCVSFVNNGK